VTYPTTVQFLLADDCRQEPGNKFSVLGFLPGDDLIAEGMEAGMALPSLVVIIIFRDGEGTFASKVRIISETSGSEIQSSSQGTAVKQPHKSLTMVLKFAPFFVKEFGTYRLIVSLDDKEYQFPFRILDKLPEA